MTILAALPEAGYYFSLLKLIVLVVLTLPWLYLAPWISHDTKRVHAPQELWTAGVLSAGVIGVLVWLLMPIYFVGLIIYIVLVTAVSVAYVVYRNGRVPEEMKVLTSEHLSSLFQGKRGQRQVVVTHRVKLYDNNGRVVPAPDDDADPAEKDAYNAAQTLLYDMLFYRASEADIQPAGAEARVRLVIDGVVTDRPPLEIAESEAVIQYLKPKAGMSAEDRRRPQQGKVSVDIAGKPIDMILVSAGTTGGQRVQFKIVQEFVQTHLELLGMAPDVLERVKELASAPNGMLIVSGKSGSGVTSTLYSILRVQDAFMKQLVTMEAKPIVDLENITQTGYGDPSKFTAMLATTIRRDPDFLMLDMCDDPKAAAMLVPFVQKKSVLLGLSAGDSFQALAKWIKLCGNAEDAVAGLRGVLSQLLVRKLCTTCREEYRPDPRFLAKVNIPASKVASFYRPPTKPLVDEKGQPYTCPTCQGVGYFGRTAVFELLEITDDVRDLMAGGASLTQIQAACRKNKMLYLQEQALRKVIEGVTSIQEVIRVTQTPKK